MNSPFLFQRWLNQIQISLDLWRWRYCIHIVGRRIYVALIAWLLWIQMMAWLQKHLYSVGGAQCRPDYLKWSKKETDENEKSLSPVSIAKYIKCWESGTKLILSNILFFARRIWGNIKIRQLRRIMRQTRSINLVIKFFLVNINVVVTFPLPSLTFRRKEEIWNFWQETICQNDVFKNHLECY